MESFHNILSTKLNIPKTSPDCILRPNLHIMLKRGLDVKLTLISAPAGYGKTTLISQWLRQDRLPSAWLVLDEMDNDPKRFFIYLISALKKINPSLAESASSFLSSPMSQPSRENIIPSLIKDFDDITTNTVVVLDDYHLITNRDIHELLDYLINFLPDRVHLFISSRTDPPLSLPKLRARGHLNEIMVSDLKFSLSEIKQFMQTVGIELTNENLSILNDKTEGWIAGLRMVGAMTRKNKDMDRLIKNLSGISHYIFEYLEEEVFLSQPDNIKEFLLKTAILDRMTPALCNVLCNVENAHQILTVLKRENLFIYPLDNEYLWYRYHQFFADQLKMRIHLTHLEIIGDLHKKAGRWFYKHGYIDDALGHAIAGNHFDFAADILEDEIDKVRQSCKIIISNRLMDKLPDTVILSRSVLSTYKAMDLLLNNKLTKSRQYLEHAERIIEEKKQSDLTPIEMERKKDVAGQILSIKSWLSSLDNQHNTSLLLAEKALKHLDPENNLYLPLAWGILYKYHIHKGNLEKAEHALSQSLLISTKTKNIFVDFITSSGIIKLQMMRGQLQRARILVEKELARYKRDYPDISPRFPGFGLFYILKGAIYQEINDIDNAEENLIRGIEMLWNSAVVPNNLVYGYVIMARILVGKGDFSQAKTIILQAQEIELSYQNPTFHNLSAFLCEIDLRMDNLVAVKNWIEEKQLSADDEIPEENQMSYIVLSRYFMAIEDYQNALLVLEKLIVLSEKGQRCRTTIQILILTAIACFRNKDNLASKGHICRALEISEPEGFLSLFIVEGLPLVQVLEMIDLHFGKALSGRLMLFTGKIIDLIASKSQTKTNDTRNIDIGTLPLSYRLNPLSKREKEVLKEIDRCLTYQEIADKLFVSLNTIRTHTRNIYAKLDVNTRTEAVSKAKKAGII